MTLRCVATWCRLLGQHVEGCGSETCRGCLPRLAADGLRLCLVDVAHLVSNALRAADVYDELAEALVTESQGATEAVAGTRDRGLRLNPRAVTGRAAIEDVLASWCQLIVDERGHEQPARLVPTMAQYVATNATWLAAYPAADDCADELRELAYGEPWRVAYPTRARVLPLGPCPLDNGQAEASRCAGTLRAIMRAPESLRRSEIVCDSRDEHRWEPHQWLTLRRRLVDASLSTVALTMGVVAA